MIIGLCGRISSGKSELAKVCEKCGYKKLYFALPLKQLCAEILGITIEELNKAKRNNDEIDIIIDNNICEFLNEKTNIPFDVIKQTCLGKNIKNIRQMLQFIGTDLIRRYNIDWHVNKLREMIDTNKDYVFDDVRFPNEKKMIEDLGGDCWYVVRPKIDNVSNHESETSITWHDCYNKVIINDSTLPYLLFKWEIFLDNYRVSCHVRDKNFQKILENGTDELKEKSINDMMFISKAMFTYVPKDYTKEDIKTITMNEDKSIFITFNDDSMELIDNPLIIEDLKILL